MQEDEEAKIASIIPEGPMGLNVPKGNYKNMARRGVPPLWALCFPTSKIPLAGNTDRGNKVGNDERVIANRPQYPPALLLVSYHSSILR